MSRIEFIEGRNHAVSTLESLFVVQLLPLSEEGVSEVLDNLERGAAARPAAFAEGVLSVTRRVRK